MQRSRRFYNRADDLEALEERWASNRAQFFVLFGRRRVGKTELLLQFIKDKRALYFEATSSTEKDHLDDISRLIAELSGRSLLESQPLTSWAAVFAALNEELDRGPLAIAIDEFQFIARETRDIGSQLNRFWQKRKNDRNLFLILAGSDVSFFERDVVGYSATSYGRRTGSLRLLPFLPWEVKHFLHDWDPNDLVRAYAVFGGMPYYLDALDPRKPLAENILRHILASDALLREEPLFQLSQEARLRDAGPYFSVLRAIAAGKTKRSEIADRADRSDDQAGQMLRTLGEMGLVRRVHPVTVKNPDRTKIVRYCLNDQFLRFWFIFVYPHQSHLHDRRGARRHLEKYVLPRLDAFVSKPAFEEVCQDWLKVKTGAAAVGYWWGSVKERTEQGLRNVGREVDAVAVDADGKVIALGACKWTAGRMSYLEKIKLRALTGQVCPDGEEPDLYFFSRSGFDKRLAKEAAGDSKCQLIEVADLFDR